MSSALIPGHNVYRMGTTGVNYVKNVWIYRSVERRDHVV